MGEPRGTGVLERDVAEDTVRVDTRQRRGGGRDRRRAVTLLLLTLVLPGSAQVAAGNRALGRVALRAFGGAVALALVLGLVGLASRTALLTLLTHRVSLVLLQVLLVGLAVLWVVLLVDAWRLGRPDRLPSRDRRRLLVLLLVLLLVPGLVGWLGSTVGTARAAMTSVFGTGEAAGAVDGRYNVLLLGGDSGAGRIGMRPDSIQLASVDADTGRAVLFGFSRETENIHFRPGSVMAGLMPEGWTCGDECLLNALYTWGHDHADRFPAGTKDPGLLATREAVESLTGLDIQYYVMVDLKGFSSVVDAVGGLDITVQRRTPMGGGSREIFDWIEPGAQHLDGYHALWYARSRTKSTNYERMARQRCVVTALVKQLDPQTVLLHFGDLAAATKGVFRTDIPQDALAGLADVAVKTKQEKITSVNFVPPLIKPWDYDPAVVRSTVSAAIAASEKGPAAPKPTAASTAKAAPTAKSTPKPEASTPAVMERPGTDPDANTGDLASVCSAG
ncbi:LCP family protein [Phycicoccus sonneratiae]|uniref:LCP family protein n=1 Tax=Phycicoccus sonneratiae TaxID=2807628 RepID=A0ABS2CNG7_9MICO|nr:LCP family protein [Phycicoccus sonneraticus]MBM6400993.1 LCP family protein [Phycicoccus sonneraticus]